MQIVRTINIFVLLTAGVLGFSSSAYSESYFGFGMGVSIPKDYSRVKIRGAARVIVKCGVWEHDQAAFL
jgi:hypothetical protein